MLNFVTECSLLFKYSPRSSWWKSRRT